MSNRAIADTSLFIARETGRPLDPYEEDREIAVSMVTIAELELGVLAAAEPRIRAARLQTLRDAEQLSALPVDRTVASAFATLVVEMRAAGRGRLGVQDAWIAATAITYDADLLTQDADFDGVPSLRVIKL
ncbi:type II toxin-antitoxin system toxin ribonuclease C4 [soil metagenome]|nr:PIN domain-containing protein [Thermoleophilaceae bacterium]MDQ3241475.1 PIN domain-containing protein [Actinomycetota bacterium]MDQ3357088.1 PIN domain-containing protein [Actinomycetota bacterium]